MKQLLLLLIISLTLVGINGQEFTIGVLPDIQNMSQSDLDALKIKKITQYYIDNKNALNLKMVVSLGDNVYGYNTDAVMQTEYTRIKPAFDNLKKAGIPYAPCVGNHDGQMNDQTYTFFNNWFPINEMQTQNPYLMGNLNGSANTYYLFSQAGMDFVMVVIETHDQFIIADKKLDYDQASITWANAIFNQYANRRAIFVTHDLFEFSGYKLINDVIKKNDNIFLALCGHSCSRPGFNGTISGEYAWTETTNGGKKVQCVLSNFQCDADQGATLRYYTFKPAEDKIYAYTYNVVNNAFKTGTSSQFTLDYTMNGLSPRISLTQNGEINEGAENGKTIAVTLTNGLFWTTLTKANWSASNLPSGVSIGAVTRISDTQASITLSGNSTIGSYNSNITNVAITASKAEITSSSSGATANTGIILSKNALQIPGKIEAEAFSSMNLIQLESCTDTGGGQNIGYIDAGDWLTYNVNISNTADYKIEFRVASLSIAGKIEIQLDGITKQTIDLPITKAWQTWLTDTKLVNLTAGLHALKINVLQGGFNLNWLNLTLNNPVTNPIITNLVNTPTSPTSSSPVTVLATITDDKSISSAKLFWGTSATNTTNPVIMVANGNSYSATIPAQANGRTIFYNVTATDGDANSTNSLVASYLITDKTAITIADYDGVDLAFAGFDGANFTKIVNPVKGGINVSNNVGQVIKSNASQTWAGIKSTPLSAKLDFSANNYLRIKVYSPKICTVLLKLEDASNAAINKEIGVVTSKVNEWEELLFEFTGTASNTYNRIVLFFDFGNTIGNTFYFDDVKQSNDPTKALTTVINQSVVADNKFMVYPNPTVNGNITIEMNDNALCENNIQIFDILGYLKMEKVKQLDDKSVVMNIQSLIPGIYIIKVAGQAQKLVVQ